MNICYESFDAGHCVKIEDFTFYKCTVLAQDYNFFLCEKKYIYTKRVSFMLQFINTNIFNVDYTNENNY